MTYGYRNYHKSIFHLREADKNRKLFPNPSYIDKPSYNMSRNTPSKANSVNQVGGSGSDFSNLWYSWEVSPAELSRITLEKIDCAPMFNPLRKGTVIPTGTSGIIPAGVYLAALPPLVDSCATVECYNRGQIGLVTPPTDVQTVAMQQAAAAQRLRDQQFVNQLAAQEGLPQQTGMVSDNGLINSLAQFMGMNQTGPSQTGSGLGHSTQVGGNARTLKMAPVTRIQNKAQEGGCCGSGGFYTGNAEQMGGACQGCGNNGKSSHMTMAQKQGLAQQRHAANMQRGGTCGTSQTTMIGPNQTQQGGTLSNGLGYSPFKGSQWTATSCANSCVPFNNTCNPLGLPTGRGRQPVYYSETESREGCTTRCRMPPGTYASSNLGCRSTAFASRDIDYGTYEDLHGTNLAANAAPLPQPCVKRL